MVVDGIPMKEWIAKHNDDDFLSAFSGPEYMYSSSFMCRIAADETGIPWSTFRKLPYDERARVVAYHRTKGELNWVKSRKAAIKAKRTVR